MRNKQVYQNYTYITVVTKTLNSIRKINNKKNDKGCSTKKMFWVGGGEWKNFAGGPLYT